MGIRSEMGKYFDIIFSKLHTGQDARLHPSLRFHNASGIPEEKKANNVNDALFDEARRFEILHSTFTVQGEIYDTSLIHKNGKDKATSKDEGTNIPRS